ncbi:MAG: type II secretion system F family protein [Phycisphaeraceae bacterium]|nr:type II secretion system F family protein [Phycisphaeraceae bacterium]
MSVFEYVAVSEDGQRRQGAIDADSPRIARDRLRSQGLRVTSLREARPSGNRLFAGWRHPFAAFRHQRQTATFIRELATLLGVGTPLSESLQTIARQYHGTFRQAIEQLQDRIRSGSGLAQAMREHPRLFDDICVSIVEVGENAGTLDTALDRLGDFMDHWLTLRGRVVTALTYPAIVMLVGLCVTLFLMTFVVPNLLTALMESGRPLPWPTRIVKTCSDCVVYRGWLLALLAVGAATAGSYLLRTSRGRRAFDRLLLRLPILGDLIVKQSVVRIAVVLSALLGSGVVFLHALQIARRALRNSLLCESLDRCGAAITAGQDIGAAMADEEMFPPLVIQVFSVGQESGRLEEMLARLARDYDRQVQTTAGRLTAVLEPLLILAMAIFVGLVAAATLLPILDASHVQ